MANLSKSARKRPGHKVTPVQYGASLLGFAVISIIAGVLMAGFLVPVVGATGAVVKAVPASFDEIPGDIDVVIPAEESRMVDAEGKHMARFFSQRRVIVSSEQMADILRKAIVSIEDKRFPTHRGIDAERMVGAMVQIVISGGKKLEGASTITQQLVKNQLAEQALQHGDVDLADEASEVSPERKLREVRYAMTLESKMTKDEILTAYLNIAAFGPNVYGVEAASRAYFSIPASEVSIAQAALLAGLVQSPVQYDPLTEPEAAQNRRDIVLNEMEKDGIITEEEKDEAQALTVDEMLKPETRINGCQGAGNKAYYCDFVIDEFLSDPAFGETRADRLHLLETGGLVLRTTIRAKEQDAAWNAAVETVPLDQEDHLNDAIVAVDPRDGHIRAMAQNTNYKDTVVSYTTYTGGGRGFQPASTFKTFTLLQWFKEGNSAYDTVGLKDRNLPAGSFTCNGQQYYTGAWPVGDLPGKDGPHLVQQVVNQSINQGFVDMATKVDYCKIFEGAHDLGIETVDGEAISPEAPSGLIGGSSDVAPILMASAYGTFANDGIRCKPMGLVEVADRDGKVIKKYEPDCKRVLDSQVAQQVATVLKRTANQYGRVDIWRPVAAKTGTSENNANNWVVGFTPQLASAAWVGFASNSSRPVQDIWINGQYVYAMYGENFVGPMWSKFMIGALDGEPVVDLPEAFVGVPKALVSEKTPAPDGDDADDATAGASTSNDTRSNRSNTPNQEKTKKPEVPKPPQKPSPPKQVDPPAPPKPEPPVVEEPPIIDEGGDPVVDPPTDGDEGD